MLILTFFDFLAEISAEAPPAIAKSVQTA